MSGMSFKISKTIIMTLYLRKSSVDFHLLGEKIRFVKESKYLGVTISNKRQACIITHQISSISKKAERKVNCFRHLGLKSDGMRPAINVQLYKTLVRPVPEYAAQVLNYRHYYYHTHEKDSRNTFEND